MIYYIIQSYTYQNSNFFDTEPKIQTISYKKIQILSYAALLGTYLIDFYHSYICFFLINWSNLDWDSWNKMERGFDYLAWSISRGSSKIS